MASAKRKAGADSAPSAKAAKTQHELERSPKRRKSSAARQRSEPESAAGKENRSAAKTATTSIFKTEGKAFPRGGAPVLTPLEHRQIQRQAEQDVLFEQPGNKKGWAPGDDEEEPQPRPTVKEPKKRRKSNSHKDISAAANDEPKVKIECLSFKTIALGTLVLGRISQITSRGLVIALPNNLTGFAPLTAISDQFLRRLEQFANNGEENGEEIQSEDDEIIDLQRLFRVGQYLRAVVTSTADEASLDNKTKKRIELSINPREVNKSISKSDLVTNSMIQASVVSSEEHGLVMDMGLEDSAVRGFMPAKELGAHGNHENIREGMVFLCLVTGTSSEGRVVKLSVNRDKTGDAKQHYLHDAPSLEVFLPGACAEMLVTHVAPYGMVGKVMGFLDATADIFHSGTLQEKPKEYNIGNKVKARVICTFPGSEPRKIGVSLLPHLMNFSTSQHEESDLDTDPLQQLPLSSFIDEAKILKVFPSWGVSLDAGVKGVNVFVHVSRMSDKTIESPSAETGPYAIGTRHRARIMGYNAVDGLLLASLQDSILQQPFLRVDDIQNGQVVKGTVEKFHFTTGGAAGLLVHLAEGITGFVPEIHLADVQLQHPERRYREGMPVTARVLSVDAERRRVSLTLKKSLVNSETEVWTDYDSIEVGAQAAGTITKLVPTGAEVHFFGRAKGWLHRSEMSEAFIADPTKHFRLGQTVNVRVLSVDAEKNSLKLSCKDPAAVSIEARNAFKSLAIGSIVKGTVLEKTSDSISLELDGGVKATLKLGHLTDKSEKGELSVLKRIHVGQTLDNLVVLKKVEDKVAAILSRKPSLCEAARAGTLLRAFEEVREEQAFAGFVRRIDQDKVFIEFAAGLCGALFKSQMTDEMLKLPDFGLRPNQSVTATVSHIDYNQKRFRLSMKTLPQGAMEDSKDNTGDTILLNPVDGKTRTVGDYKFGVETAARIKSVKAVQLNVQLADRVQGRVHVTEVFDVWDDIANKKNPLREFKPNQVIPVRVIGMHQARTHKYLPISHQQGKLDVFELSAKKTPTLSSPEDLLTLDKLSVGSTYIAFVNSHSANCLWVDISPTIRGRIRSTDLSDDISILANTAKHFPVGSAILVKVQKVDAAAGRLDLVAANKLSSAEPVTWDTLSRDKILPGRVIKTTERSVIISLSPTVSGPIPLTEIADDYDEAKPSTFTQNEFIRVKVISIDLPNKKVVLSSRPSNVLDSSIKPRDRQILSLHDLAVNDVVRGFVKNVSDKGLFINLGPAATGFVRICDLSDSYLKDWKSSFQVDQLVTGKIIAVDPAINHVQMALKQSILDKDYVAPLTFNDLEVGQVVTGEVKKVEEFGVFILIDNSNNIRGLCHRSEMAEEKVNDARTLYEEGDKVKAVVLKVDKDKRRINFGLKASYFQDNVADDELSDDESDSLEGGVSLESEEDDSEGELDSSENEQQDADSPHSRDFSAGEGESADEMDVDSVQPPLEQNLGLRTSGFDWTGANMDNDEVPNASASEDDDATSKKKRRRKPEIQVDRTGDLDLHGPRSVADFERLLLGQPHSSLLWISYMAFQLQLNEVEKGREIARRALRAIDAREEDEKLQVRIALLNLENTFGSDETLEEAFKEACQYHDERAVHDKLVGIYVQSGKVDKADSVYSSMLTNKSFRADPELWLSYATFLFSNVNDPPRARALLSRATQSIPGHLHRYITSKFGALEFKSPNGDHERGRTIFEGLLSAYPRKWDLWDMYVDLEDTHGEEEKARALYERMSRTKMKKARARKMFGNWAKWEGKKGNDKGAERVSVLELEWMEKNNDRSMKE